MKKCKSYPKTKSDWFIGFNNQTGKITFIYTQALLSYDTKTINVGHQKVQIYMIVNKPFLAVFGHVKDKDFRLKILKIVLKPQ